MDNLTLFDDTVHAGVKLVLRCRWADPFEPPTTDWELSYEGAVVTGAHTKLPQDADAHEVIQDALVQILANIVGYKLTTFHIRRGRTD